MKKLIIKNWWRYLIGITFLVISVLLDVWFPIVTVSIVDDVIIGGDMAMLRTDLIYILIIGLGRAVAQYVKEFNCDMAGCNVAEGMRKNLMNHLQGLSKRYFDNNNTGELMAHVKDDTGKIWDLCGFVSMLFIEATLYFIGVIIAMFRLNWKLALIPIAFMPLMGVLVMKLEKKLDKMYDDLSEENATLTRVIEENITGVRCVKAFAAEKFEIGKFAKHNKLYGSMNSELDAYMSVMNPIIDFIPKIMQGIVIAVAGYWAITGNITYGILVAFIQYSSNIVWPIQNMGWLTNSLSSAFASLKKINKILAAQPEITEKADAVALDHVGQTLCFDHVSFALDDAKILDDVSFTLEKGKTLGIMGATGAGKSTMVSLIERFYDVTEGKITIDGIDVRDLKLTSVRDFSSVVTQDIFLFSDTIRQNVKLGQKKTLPDSTVEIAIHKAHAEEFVKKLTGGYDTVIGERGIGLSGGQKQRLSIARALAKQAGVLIMDDSTSALDMETETDIQKELKEKKDMSKIIIAHRISSVKDADEIIVLSHGRIAERGTHESLMALKGQYYSTYEAQFGDYRKALEVMEGGVN